MSILNRFQSLFRAAPVAAPVRAFKRSLLAGARNTKLLMDWVTSALSIDKTVRQSIGKLRSRARELSLNNPFVRQYLALLQANVIGHRGMKLQAQVRLADGTLDKTVNDALEEAFSKWSRHASADGRLTLTQVAHLAVKTLAIDGEVFIELVTENLNESWFALHVIDSDLVDHDLNRARGVDGKGAKANEIRMGVEVDLYGRPVALHLRTHHPSEAAPSGASGWRVIPADRVLHIFDPERADQTRGISWFNSVMVTLHHQEKYSEATLVAARTASAKMGFLRYTDTAAIHLAQEGGADDVIPNGPLQYDASPGSIEMLPPGLEFQEWNPAQPATTYGEYNKALLREIASGLQVSYNALANDLEGVNYSSLRSGMLVERDTWRRLQQLFIDRFYLPIFEAWLSNALLAGAINVSTRDAKKLSKALFIPRGWTWVDPLKDVNASILAVQNGFASRTQICGEQGLDYEEIVEQLAEEAQLRDAAGLTDGAGADAKAVEKLLEDADA